MTASVSLLVVVAATPDSSPSVTHGVVPTNWYVSGSSDLTIPNFRFTKPNVVSGQRLSGVVTITPIIMRTEIFIEDQALFASIPKRLLLDGVAQASWTIDTHAYPDGTYVLGIQVDGPEHGIENGARIVVFNNSGASYTAKNDQAVLGPILHNAKYNSLAWARVDVREPAAYPMTHGAAKHPLPTDADAEELAAGDVWWIEGLQHQGTGLYTNYPMLVKNAQGDHFITQWNPQMTADSVQSLASVKSGPAYDGPRGIGILSPYAMAVAGTRVLASSLRGWLAVDIAGRLVDLDISGAVSTIFGPRSVAGVVGTDPSLTAMTLAQRIAAGEKEIVGSGEQLVMPQDCWPIDDDLTLIADTGANKVSRVSRAQGRIVSTSAAIAVTSVWQGFGSEWWVTPNSLWRDGVKVATIPDAFFVRGDELRGSVYVLTRRMFIYEVDPLTGTAVSHLAGLAPAAIIRDFVFMDVDLHGHAGPKGRIYFSMSVSYNNNAGIHYTDPGTWEEFDWKPKIFNSGNKFSSEQARSDLFGHYLWAFAIHPDEAMWISTGISNTSYKLGTAHLGDVATRDTPVDFLVYKAGEVLWKVGRRDKNIGLGHVFGGWGHGALGYSVDQLRSGTIADFRALLDPLLPADYTDAERTAIATYLWWQRTRGHFVAVQ